MGQYGTVCAQTLWSSVSSHRGRLEGVRDLVHPLGPLLLPCQLLCVLSLEEVHHITGVRFGLASATTAAASIKAPHCCVSTAPLTRRLLLLLPAWGQPREQLLQLRCHAGCETSCALLRFSGRVQAEHRRFVGAGVVHLGEASQLVRGIAYTAGLLRGCHV
jgi:hypothetical protein